MSVVLTPTLQNYAILTNTGMSGGGTVNIQNGYYGALTTQIYNVTITSTGTPNGENSTNVLQLNTDLNTLITSINAYEPVTNVPGPSNYGPVTITPGKYKIYNQSNPSLTDDLTINANTAITFNAQNNPNAVFIITAKNIIFENNITIILKNGARNINIFWISDNTISFIGTTTYMPGIFYANSITVNNLTVKGHIFCRPLNLTVTGTLNINGESDPYYPSSDICFVKNTPIETDQGIIPIQNLQSFHTIQREPIVAITKTKYLDNYLVCFEKHALEKNCPSQRTIVSKNHKILYKNTLVSAHKLILPRFEKFIYKIPYDGEILYNILLKKHSTVRVNNLVCETLDPNTLIGQLYANKLLTDKHIVNFNKSMMQEHEKQKIYTKLIHKL